MASREPHALNPLAADDSPLKQRHISRVCTRTHALAARLLADQLTASTQAGPRRVGCVAYIIYDV